MTATTVKEEIYLDQAKKLSVFLQRMQHREIKKAEHLNSKKMLFAKVGC
ncbi:hypothetical protein MUB16_31700 [Priestia sp. OVL9]|nr:hypothetical protein [Priestia sp. OVL9]